MSRSSIKHRQAEPCLRGGQQSNWSRFQQLEPRRVLNASFGLTGDALVLDSFDAADGQLTISGGVGLIDGNLVSTYRFNLASGGWDGDLLNPSDGIEVSGSQLSVAQSLFSSHGLSTDLIINDSNSVGVDILLASGMQTYGGDVTIQTSGSLASLSTAPLITTGNELGEASGAVTLSADSMSMIGKIDSSGLDLTGATSPDVSDAGAVLIDSLSGSVVVSQVDALAGQTDGAFVATGTGGAISISAAGSSADLSVLTGLLTDSPSGIRLSAADSIFVQTNAHIELLGPGAIELTANSDGAIGDSGNMIEALPGSRIAAADGRVQLSTLGDWGGDISVHQLAAGDALTVDSADRIRLLGQVTTQGGDVVMTAADELHSDSVATITTTPVSSSGLGSGAVTLIAGGDLILEGDVSTAGVDSASGPGGHAGDIMLNAQDGLLSVANLNVSGGSSGAAAGGNAGQIVLNAADVGNNQLHSLDLTSINGRGGAGSIAGDDASVIIRSDHDVSLLGPVDLGAGLLWIQAEGDLTQAAEVQSGELGLVVRGQTDLTNVGNAIGTVAALNRGQTFIASTIDLEVGSVSNGSTLLVGATVQDADVKLVSDGSIEINNTLSTGTGRLQLIAAGDVGQTAPIFTQAIGLMVGGQTRLQNSLNSFELLAADNSGNTFIHSSSELTLGQIEVGGMVITGLTTDAASAKLSTGGQLTITTRIDVGSADIFLMASGDVTQGAAIAARSLGVVSDGSIRLNDAANAVDTFASAASGDLIYVDLDGFQVGTVELDGMSVAGANSATGNILLQSGDDLILAAGRRISANHVTLWASDDIYLSDQTAVQAVESVAIFATNSQDDSSAAFSMTGSSNIISSNGNIRIASDNGGDLSLTTVQATDGDVSLIAEGAIVPAQGSLPNVTANQLRIWADAVVLPDGSHDESVSGDGIGGLGGPDASNGSPDSNQNAIEVDIDALAGQAAGGIYVAAISDLSVQTVSQVEVFVVQSDGSLATLTDAQQAGLASEAGPIKLQAVGAIDINAPVQATGGDILLQSLSSDVQVNAPVISIDGNLTIDADDDVDIQATIGVQGSGAIVLIAGDSQADALSGVRIGAALAGLTGNLFVQSDGNVTLQQAMETLAGSIRITASGQLDVQADITATEDVALVAGTGLAMLPPVSVFAGSAAWLETTDGDMTISTIQAEQVAVLSSGNIADADQSEAVNIRADRIALLAGGRIGGPDAMSPSNQNRFAIDIATRTLSASGAAGVYLQQAASAGSLIVDTVSVESDATAVRRVNFNSTQSALDTSDLSLEQSDLSAHSGNIKVVALAGNIEVRDGTDSDLRGIAISQAGDILLEARGLSSRLTISAAVETQMGHINLFAGRDIFFNDGVASGDGSLLVRAALGSIAVDDTMPGNGSGLHTVAGDILLQAARDIHLISDLSTGAGDIGLVAGQEFSIFSQVNSQQGDILVAAETVSMTAGSSLIASGNIVLESRTGAAEIGLLQADSVGIVAAGNIVDADASIVTNLRARQVSLRAGGDIGFATASQTEAIDTEVETISALGGGEVYLRESLAGGDLTVGRVEPLSVTVDGIQSVHFNSTTELHQAAMQQVAALDDIESVGEITLQTAGGSIILSDGADTDGRAVSTVGAATIRLIALGSGSSNIELLPEASIQTGSGDIVLAATGNITLGAPVTTARSGPVTGEVALLAGGHIDESSAEATIVADNIVLFAGTAAHLHATQVNSLTANVVSNRSLDGAWQLQNVTANAKGDDFLDVLGTQLEPGVTLTAEAQSQLDALRAEHRFVDRFGGEYALFVRNDTTLSVDGVTAGDGTTGGSQPNVYLETLTGDLIVRGDVLTTSVTDQEGGIVAIAGGQLQLENGGAFLTQLVSINRAQVVNSINRTPAAPVDVLSANFFSGGEGIEPDNPSLTSTQFVIRENNLSGISENYRTHAQQRVAMQFGASGESGFLAIIGYADGNLETFSTAGQEGTPANVNGDSSSIASHPRSNTADAAIFTRTTSFNAQFLDTFQDLPTTAIVRRASDLFLFEEGGQTDLTVESSFISNVISLGDRGALPLPVDPQPAPIPIFTGTPAITLVEAPAQIFAEPIELPVVLQSSASVAIYWVEYEDANLNGQVDESELPSYEEILRDGLSEQSQSSRIPIEPSTAGATPTQEDIARAKNELLQKPGQPSGAYAIIREDTDGRLSVLDVFAVRDFEESEVEQVQESDQVIELRLPAEADAGNIDENDSADPNAQPPLEEGKAGEDEAGQGPIDIPAAESEQAAAQLQGALMFPLFTLGGSIVASNPATEENKARQSGVQSRMELGSSGNVDFSSRARRIRKLSR